MPEPRRCSGLFPFRRAAASAAVFSSLAAFAVGQEAEPSVEGRLLEILRKRGVITSEEHAELRTLEASLRADAAREEALDHRVDEMTARLVQDSPKISYKAGQGFQFASADGNFSLRIGGRIQTRFEYEFEEDDDGDGAAQDDLPNFLTPRLRLRLRGHAFDPKLTYDFHFDFGGDVPKGSTSPSNVVTGVNFGAGTSTSAATSFTGSEQLAELKDAFFNYEIADKAFQVRAGQFKTPYSRAQLTSAFSLEFVDRAPTDRFFAPARQKGAMLHGALGGEKSDLFEWAAGAFDGEGENALNNDDGLMWVGRLAVNPFGAVPYAEADLRPEDKRGKFLAALGVNGWYHQEDARGTDDVDAWSIGADLAMHWYGFHLGAEVHYRETDRATSAAPPNDMELTGYHVMLGYMLVPETFEVGVRYSEVDWENATSQSAAREMLVVLGYYFHGHDMKVQLDFGKVENHFLAAASNDDDYRLRLQFSFQF
jgi:hypothetical protein